MAKLPHCKAPSHLHVSLDRPGGTVWPVTATYQPKMSCENHVTSPGVVISHRKDPLEGLHLLPEAIGWLPTELREHADAAEPGDTVTISHTSNKVFVRFVTVTPAGARQLADAIEKVALM